VRRKLFTAASLLSLLLWVATMVLWAVPGHHAWPYHGLVTETIYISMWPHRALILNVVRESAAPDIGPLETDPNYNRWYFRVPDKTVFQAGGLSLERHSAFRGMFSHDGTGRLVRYGQHWTFTVPFPLISLLFLYLPILRAVRAWHRRVKVPRKGRCGICRYDLTGNTSGICPECGRPIKQKAEATA
jgi:hypothetical protein